MKKSQNHFKFVPSAFFRKKIFYSVNLPIMDHHQAGLISIQTMRIVRYQLDQQWKYQIHKVYQIVRLGNYKNTTMIKQLLSVLL